MRDFSAEARLVLVRVKIKRAEKHLQDFETQAQAFKDAYTHVVGTETDSKTLQAQQYFAKLPISGFGVLAAAGDVVQNLRSALDHLAFQLVEAGQCRRIGERAGKRIGFPIFDTAKEYKARKTRKIKGARKAAIKAIDALKPYKSGNRFLWSLNRVNIIDKHRYLIEVGPDYLFEGDGFGGHFWRKAIRWRNAAGPLFKGIFGPEMNQNAQVVIKKSSSKSGVGEGQPLLEFLREAVQSVDDLVGTFEYHLRPRGWDATHKSL
jgi:hypothetical protein